MSRLTGKYRVVVKRLSAVETDPSTSNQHEFNGTKAIRDLLGSVARRGIPCRWLHLRDGHEPQIEDHTCSWYDARENHVTRTEWRLYYDGTPRMSEGDLLVCIEREGSEGLVYLVAAEGSTWESQLLGLFGHPASDIRDFAEVQFEDVQPAFAGVARELFELLGWMEQPVEVELGDFERLEVKFGSRFPTTKEFSAFARSLVPENPGDPDQTLMCWWQREEALFRAFEERELKDRLKRQPPFTGVEDFVGFSLSIQNRRKSRAGHALENHVEALLQARGLRYSKNPRTEGDRRPDFVLPGEIQYHDNEFPSELLTTLATKTSCKDRWRQVLNEAARVKSKHLLTLEAAISRTQLSEMNEESVILVVPRGIVSTYTPPEGMRLWTITDFVLMAEERQRRAPA